MNEKELIALDLWVDINVFNQFNMVGLRKRGLWYRPNAKGYTHQSAEAWRLTRAEAKPYEYLHDEPVTICELPIPRYTTDPAAAMEVLKKCAEKIYPNHFPIRVFAGGWQISLFEPSETPELAICLFARKLFTEPAPNTQKEE